MALSPTQVRDCFQSTDLIGIGMEADAIRRRLHPDNVVTYTADQHTQPSTDDVAARANTSGKSIRETLERLRDEGLTLLADAEGLPVLPIGAAANALPFELYLEVHRTAHQLGIPSSAVMLFGCGETLDQRVAHLVAIAELQQETGGLLSFAASAYQPTSRAGLPAEWEEATAVESLKTLAVSRIALSAVPTITADCTHHPLKVLQMAFRFGVDDAGALTPNHSSTPSEEDLRRIIRDAGLHPVLRDRAHRLCYLSD